MAPSGYPFPVSHAIPATSIRWIYGRRPILDEDPHQRRAGLLIPLAERVAYRILPRLSADPRGRMTAAPLRDALPQSGVSLLPTARPAYRTSLGLTLHGRSEELLATYSEELKGKIQLIFTSPPFPLNNKKRYDNFQGEQYLLWLSSYASIFRSMLTDNGSIVIELGNAWEPGKPVMSTLALESLLTFLKAGQLHLCQQFVCHNPARLPSPAAWVTVRRERVTDSYTNLWWMSRSVYPKSDNRKVLQPYSEAMKRLIARRSYNTNKRPSDHSISQTSFFRDNGGSIPSNVLQFSNTASRDEYLAFCRSNKLPPHPARMPTGLPEFFIKFLTDPGDTVLDPFGGSNTTGAAAEKLGRKWITIEAEEAYVSGSKGRFLKYEKPSAN
jgi:hypothetical protein